MPENRHAEPSDAALAFLYVSGELPDAEVEAFETRLAGDQALRDILCQAVQLLHTLQGDTPLAPRPAYRLRVRQRLRATGGWWRRLAGPRLSRGHPVLWCGLGAAAAVLVMMLLPVEPSSSIRETIVLRRGEAEQGERESLTVTADGSATIEMAELWANLHNTNHLARAREDENRRRVRAEDRRFVHSDDSPFRLRVPSGSSH
jgi:anti-sigma-K factor RskA